MLLGKGLYLQINVHSLEKKICLEKFFFLSSQYINAAEFTW